MTRNRLCRVVLRPSPVTAMEVAEPSSPGCPRAASARAGQRRSAAAGAWRGIPAVPGREAGPGTRDPVPGSDEIGSYSGMGGDALHRRVPRGLSSAC